MVKVMMCDFCSDVISDPTMYDRVIDGTGKFFFKLGDREHSAIITFVEGMSGDRIEIDICPDCLKKGVSGFGGDDFTADPEH